MKEYHRPAITVDIIIEREGNLLLVRRKKDPFKGLLCIPGGFVDFGEKVEIAAKREAYEETNLRVEPIAILGVYSDPQRDPRGHTVSVSFIAKIIDGIPKAGDDADDVKWVPLDDNRLHLAFDHSRLLQDYRSWKKNNGTYWSSKLAT
ncbi:MAG TPA: NUDIX hydrolase [Nitrososphaeraceae archaeon]|jgi:8-oxo-dGTP diphosphatase